MKRRIIEMFVVRWGIIVALGMLLAATLTLVSTPVNAVDFTLGADIGRCKSSVYLEMCNESRPVWHVYGKVSMQLSERVKWNILTIDHLSSFDGMDDLRGREENQSGAFDFGGTGIEVSF